MSPHKDYEVVSINDFEQAVVAYYATVWGGHPTVAFMALERMKEIFFGESMTWDRWEEELGSVFDIG